MRREFSYRLGQTCRLRAYIAFRGYDKHQKFTVLWRLAYQAVLTGEILADHVWMRANESWLKTPLHRWISFTAKIVPYWKGFNFDSGAEQDFALAEVRDLQFTPASKLTPRDTISPEPAPDPSTLSDDVEFTDPLAQG